MKAVAFCMLTALFSHITIIQTTHFHFFNFFKHPAALLQDLQRMLDINYNRIRFVIPKSFFKMFYLIINVTVFDWYMNCEGIEIFPLGMY